MDIIRTPEEMQRWARLQRPVTQRGFVPTMGALHRGHEALIQHSKQHNDQTVLSVFVNPTQFNVSTDYEKYPRNDDRDLAIAEHHGVDVVYMPSANDMYPSNFRSYVEPGIAADPMEGAGRPGHFRGVTTIVTKLFHAVSPDVAYFGKKDFQQLAVIRQMVDELNFPITIQGLETVRDEDGLALSSRNIRLSPAARADAPIIFEALTVVRQLFDEGTRKSSRLVEAFHQAVSRSSLINVEYVTVSDHRTLEELVDIEQHAVMCVAAWYDDVRLIDNVELITR